MRIVSRILFLQILMTGAGIAAAADGTDSGAKNEEKYPLYVFEETVVTAAKMDKTPFDLPSSAEVISSDAIQMQRLIRTIPEAFEEVAGIMVQKTAHGQGSPYK